MFYVFINLLIILHTYHCNAIYLLFPEMVLDSIDYVDTLAATGRLSRQHVRTVQHSTVQSIYFYSNDSFSYFLKFSDLSNFYHAYFFS